MKAENYINIQGWMRTDLNLKGNELILYAIIYGYSQDGIHRYRGSIKYIMNALGASNSCVIDTLNKLISSGLINKEVKSTGNEYWSNLDKLEQTCENFSQGCEKSSQPTCENFSQGCEKSSQPTCEKSSHNIYNNNNNNTDSVFFSFSNQSALEEERKKKPKTPRQFTNQRRMEAGKEPLKTPRTKKQSETFDSLKWKDYFRQQGYEQHGMQFFLVESKKRESAVSKLIIDAGKTGVNLKDLIDWWLGGAGEWAQYEPEQCFMSKTIERFLNKDKKSKSILDHFKFV